MTMLNECISEAFMYALGWTLLHSLWQGTIAALVVALLLLGLHRSSSTIRYFVTTTALFTVFCVAMMTFLVLYLPNREVKTVRSSATSSAPSQQIGLAVDQPRQLPAVLTQTADRYFNRHLPAIITVWFMGITILVLRLLGGLAYLRRLRRYQLSAVAPEWQERCRELSQRIQVSPAVQLAESALVKIPMVIGYFKPLVLLPIGAINGLPTAQVEAILAHELAHIRRNDYFINFFQSLVEILFFYHPAIWWISGCIRQEREHCCDDVALSICGDSLTYAKALANLETVPYQAPRLAMSLLGRSGRLLYRIERLMKHPRRNPSFSEGIVAALVLVGSLLAVSQSATAGLGFTNVRESLQATFPFDTKQFVQTDPVDSLRKTNEVTIIKDKKGRIVELYVNGRKIPKNEIGNYQAFIEGRTQEIPAPVAAVAPAPAVGPVAAISSANSSTMALAYATDNEYESAMDRVQEEIERVQDQMEAIQEQMERQMEKSADIHEQAVKELEEKMQVQQQVLEKLQQQEEVLQDRYEQEAEVQQKQHEAEMQKYQAEMKTHETDMRKHEAEMRKQEAEMRKQEVEMRKQEKVYEAIVKELKKDRLVEDEKTCEFRMDKTGFYVNGQKQPEAVYKKYKQYMERESGKPFKDTDAIHIHYTQE